MWHLPVETGDIVEDCNPDVEPVSVDFANRAGVILENLQKVDLGKKSWWQSFNGGVRGRPASRGNSRSDIEVVKGLNLTLYEGQCFAIVVSNPISVCKANFSRHCTVPLEVKELLHHPKIIALVWAFYSATS